MKGGEEKAKLMKIDKAKLIMKDEKAVLMMKARRRKQRL